MMLMALVYGGEHYAFDCLCGGALAVLVVWISRKYVHPRFHRLLAEPGSTTETSDTVTAPSA